MKSASVLAFMVLVLVMTVLLIRQSVVAVGMPLIAVQFGAVALMIWARITFGRRSFHAAADPTEGDLVTSGPYRYFRHPIYSSILYFLWAGVVSHLSFINVSLLLIGTGAVIVRMRSEEQLLLTRYPEYAEYAKRTKRIIPFVL
jgi:protein-S-isoprenylcysteine O-methyltransferase Ste14